jgi:hypothetical protein
MKPAPFTSLAYLATPYSKYPMGLHGAFVDACRLAARLIHSGVNVYSPIAHTHPIGTYGGINPLDLTIWLPFDELMMARCDTLIVAHLPSWEKSKGIAQEIECFLRACKPIFDLDPNTMNMVKRRGASSDRPFEVHGVAP